MIRNSFFFKITVLLLVLSSFLFYYCRDFDNPVDSESDNYQGFPSVGTVNEVEPYLPTNGSSLSWCSFTCLPCPYADYYHIQVSSSNSNFEGNIVAEKPDCTSNEMTLSISESIASVNILYWRVRAHDSNSGQWGDWSSIWSFTAQGIISSGLDPPNDGATGDTTPLLNWSDFSGATGYQVQFSDSEGGVLSTTPLSVSFSQYQINTGLEEGKKYWRVRPVKSNSVAGFWSSIWIFTVNLGIPSNPDPENGVTINNTKPILGWEDVTGAISYHIQVNTMSDFTGTVIADATPSSSEYQVTTVLDNNTTYYWRVRIKDTNGVFGDWSSAWSFTVNLGIPSNPDPGNGSSIYNTKPLLGWDDVTGAEGYHIQVNTESDFTGTVKANDDTLTDSEYQVTTELDFNTPYYWHVRMKDTNEVFGDWSNTWSFTVIEWHGIQTVNDGGYYPSIAVGGNNVYISYSDGDILKFTKSTDGGATWITKTVDSTGNMVKHTSIAVSGNNVYIIYADNVDQDLKFAKSTDGGDTWPIKLIIDSTGDFQGDNISVDGDNIYICYWNPTNDDLMFAKSTDSGETWTTFRTVDSTGEVGTHSSIAVSGNKVYISYFDDTNNDLKFAKSENGGDTWTTFRTVDSTGYVGRYTSIAVDGDNVYISYSDETTDNECLKFAKSEDGGSTWPSGNIVKVDSTIESGATSIAVSGNNVYISYFDGTNYDLKFAKSENGGDTWTTFRTVDSTGYVGDNPSIVVSSINVYIAYYDGTNVDLKFAKSIDGGITW